MEAEAAARLIDVVCVEIEGRRFALPIACVEEVLPAAAPTPLPEAPPYLLGALNVRGDILPVLDLRRHLGLPARPVRESDHLILVATSSRRVVVQVDAALDLYGIDPRRVRPLEGPHRPVRSAVALDDGVLLVTDAELFLSDEEARAVEESLGCAREQRA